jgi:hypothetical protein
VVLSDPGGIKACSRWLSVVCETTGWGKRNQKPGTGDPARWCPPGHSLDFLCRLAGPFFWYPNGMKITVELPDDVAKHADPGRVFQTLPRSAT